MPPTDDKLSAERCFLCDEPTEKAGPGDGSLYSDDVGPFCRRCYGLISPILDRLEKAEAKVKAFEDWHRGYLPHFTGIPCEEDAGECEACSILDCDYGDPLHYHHDGCPSEWAEEQKRNAEASHEQRRNDQ